MMFFDPDTKVKLAEADTRIPEVLDGLQSRFHQWVKKEKIKNRALRQVYYCVDDTMVGKDKCMKTSCERLKTLFAMGDAS